MASTVEEKLAAAKSGKADDIEKRRLEQQSQLESPGSSMEHAFNQYMIENIPLKNIRLLPNSVQPRVRGLDDSYARSNLSMQGLMESIKEEGVVVPVLVMHDIDENGNPCYRLIAGERRFHAVMYLAEDNGENPDEALLLSYVCPTMPLEVIAITAMTENESRQDLTNLQRAIWLARYQAKFPSRKLRKTDLAHKWGISRVHAHSAVDICDLLEPFVVIEDDADEAAVDAMKETLHKLAKISVRALETIAKSNKENIENGRAVIRHYLETGRLGKSRQPVQPDISHKHASARIARGSKGVVKVSAEINLGEGGIEALAVLDEIRDQLTKEIQGGEGSDD